MLPTEEFAMELAVGGETHTHILLTRGETFWTECGRRKKNAFSPIITSYCLTNTKEVEQLDFSYTLTSINIHAHRDADRQCLLRFYICNIESINIL